MSTSTAKKIYKTMIPDVGLYKPKGLITKSVHQSSNHKIDQTMEMGGYYYQHPKIQPTKSQSNYQSVKTTMLSDDADAVLNQVDFGKMEKQMRQFDDQKSQLIQLYKLQITKQNLDYKRKCDELEKLRATSSGPRIDADKKITTQKSQESYLKNLVYKSDSKDMKNREYHNTSLFERKNMFGKSIIVQRSLKQFDSQRQQLEIKERNLQNRETFLGEMQRQVQQRDEDAQNLLIKINDTKKIQFQLQDDLNLRKSDLDTREAGIKQKEDTLACGISTIQSHQQVLNNLEERLSHRINQMKGFDQSILHKLIEKKTLIKNAKNNQIFLR